MKTISKPKRWDNGAAYLIVGHSAAVCRRPRTVPLRNEADGERDEKSLGRQGPTAYFSGYSQPSFRVVCRRFRHYGGSEQQYHHCHSCWLVQSRLMLFSQSLAVILGAEIGTTAMAQLIAFRLHDFALVIFTIGFVIHASAKNETIRFTGEALSGFGLLFFGLKLMSEAVAPLEEYQPFLALLRVLDNPVIGVLTGTLLTGLIQSSGAFIAIVMTLGGRESFT